MRRKTALLLVIVFVFSTIALSACSTKKAGTNTDKNGTTGTKTEKQLAVEIGPDPETIDPALNSAVDGGNMILYTHECLLTIDQKNQIAPGQAESYDVSDDGLTWTFHLRDGLKWSDGSPLTAKDFVYSC